LDVILDHLFVYQNESSNIVLFDCKNLKEKIIMANYTIVTINFYKFWR
jgi:hypothetical protein